MKIILKNLIAITLISFSFSLFSCGEDKKIEIQDNIENTETPKKTEVVETKTVQNTENDEEYYRSINNLSEGETVSKQEFSEDKAEILRIIKELSVIMENRDTAEWLKYIEPESKEYYSNPVNLRKAQKKLPRKDIEGKIIEIRTISDYFNYVFIPSRERSNVDEIRYISKTNIKAVQVRDTGVVVYYYFTKVSGKWYVRLPQL